MRSHFRKSQSGFTLIELMVSLALGLIVIGAASALFLSNKRAFASAESLGRVQENARTAFEFMARDIREAGWVPCGTGPGNVDIPTANILEGSTTDNFWNMFGDGIRGYGGSTVLAGPTKAFGTAVGDRVAGTDAIDLRGAQALNVVVSSKMPTASANIDVNSTAGITDGDILYICDGVQSTIFQVTALPGGLKIQKNQGSGSPGNCTKGMGSPVQCSGSAVGTPYLYDQGAVIAKPGLLRWYVGRNANGGWSLYRQSVQWDTASNIFNGAPQEMVDNLDNTAGGNPLSITYLMQGGGSYVDAASVTDWRNVTAVRLLVRIKSQEKVGTENQTILRTIRHTVSLRNRLQ